MSAWLLPASALTDDARAFRRRWADRWEGYVPRTGDYAPDGTRYDHRHAHPDFRNPLSSDESIRASAEFHADVVRRLAAGQAVTLLTFDFEWVWDGERGHSVSALDGLLKRDLLASMLDDPHEDDAVTHVFLSHVTVDDPRLREVWSKTANGNAAVLVVGPEMRWLARPEEECVAVHSFDSADIDALHDVERETWERWAIPRDRVALLDLASVNAYFADHREVWRAAGVLVVTEPQFRVWRDGEFDHIAEELPADLSQTDWFLVELESDAAQAMVVVHDNGTCMVHVDAEGEDEDEDVEVLFEHPGHAGSLDLDGVARVFERVVATLVRLSGSATSPADDRA